MTKFRLQVYASGPTAANGPTYPAASDDPAGILGTARQYAANGYVVFILSDAPSSRPPHLPSGAAVISERLALCAGQNIFLDGHIPAQDNPLATLVRQDTGRRPSR